MLIRSASLSNSLSDYLIQEIEARDNIVVLSQTAICRGENIQIFDCENLIERVDGC